MSNSANVASGDVATATAYNNLRADVLSPSTGHTHDGTDSKSVASGTPVATGTANAPGSAATAAKSDHVHATALAYFNDKLGADVTMTTANIYYAVLSRSLTAGTWLVIGQASMDAGGGTLRLDDGTNYFSHLYDTSGYNGTLHAVVVLASTTTVYLRGASLAAGKKVLAQAASNGNAANDQTQLTCIRIA